MGVMRNVLSLPKGSSSCITGFEIRLQTPNIILRGGPEEAAGAMVMGTLFLKTTSALSVRGLTLVLEGVRRLRWQDCTGAPSTHKLHRGEEVIFTHTWDFLSGVKGTFDLSAGTHEYAFERVLPGDLIESLEGHPRVGVSYSLKAVINRPAFYSDVCVRKSLRVVRTLLPSALELSQTMAIENIWPGKVEYLIETPRKAVAFGSYTPIEVYLSPLLKGLVPAKTSVTLEEVVTISVAGDSKKLVDKRDLLTKVYSSSQYQIANDGSDNDGRWTLKEIFELPRTLQRCVQDADNSCVKIRHKLRIVIQLQNPDGHLSELRACLPIYLYISPNFMLQENGVIAPDDLPPSFETQEAPPSYESRVFDAMIDDESITPALTSTLSSAASSPRHSAMNLSETRPGSAIDYFSLNGHLRGMMTPRSGTQSPRDLREVALANLSRVPSYESALRSNAPAPAITALPTYADFARVMGGTDRIQEDIPFPEPVRPVTVRHPTTQTRFKHNANHRPAVPDITIVQAYGH